MVGPFGTFIYQSSIHVFVGLEILQMFFFHLLTPTSQKKLLVLLLRVWIYIMAWIMVYTMVYHGLSNDSYIVTCIMYV